MLFRTDMTLHIQQKLEKDPRNQLDGISSSNKEQKDKTKSESEEIFYEQEQVESRYFPCC